MQVARLHDALELGLDRDDALVEHTPVELDLRFTRTTEEAAPAALPFQVRPCTHETALLIGEVRKFDLKSSFPRPRSCAEDFEDEPGAVQHLHHPRLFEVALLHGADGVIDDDKVGFGLTNDRGQLLHFPRAEQRRGLGMRNSDDL